MSATQAQISFAAEFVLFLAALSGTAVLVLRPRLLVADRAARLTCTAGLVLIGVASFAHGSLLVEDPRDAWVAVPRVVGLGLLAASVIRREATAATNALRAVAAVLLVSQVLHGSAADVLRIVGAALLTVTLLYAARRSIPARIAAGAASTVLLVVLAVSVTMSTVVVESVTDEVTQRVERRSVSEAERAKQTTDAALFRATGVVELLAAAASSNASVRNPLLALAADAGSPDGKSGVQYLSTVLGQLGAGEQFFTVPGTLAFATTTGQVVPGSGMPESPSEQAQMGFLEVVQDAIVTRQVQAAPEVLGRNLMAVAAAPLLIEAPAGPQLVGVIITADTLDSTYLRRNSQDDDQLGLAIVGRDGILAAAGRQPTERELRDIGADVLRSPTEARTGEGRFLAGTVVSRGAEPLAAVVASLPSRLADDARQSLFRTLFIVSLLAAMVAIVLTAIIGDRIGRGLARLTSAAEEIEAGNLDVRVEARERDELGVLGGAFDRMAGSLRTMTEELRDAAIDEARLRGRIEAVLGGMGEALVAVDLDGDVTDFNPAAEELFGMRVRDAKGGAASRLPVRLSGGDDLAARLGSSNGATWAADGTVRRRRGQDIPVVVTGAPLRGVGGETVGAVAVVRDVRREREVERMKTEFLANISHEMKTPLTPIKGYAQILATRELPPSQARSFARDIVVGARQLERVITQLVNFATMAAGRLEPNPQPVSTRAALDDVVRRWSDRVDEGHVVVRRVARGTPDLEVDRRLLDLSLDELIDNAVKYSPEGGKVTVSAKGDDGMVELAVTDRGVGVPADRIDVIFGEFTQADGSSTREFGGLGLGLPLVRHVVLAHGGDIRCASAPGRGTTVFLRFPAVDE